MSSERERALERLYKLAPRGAHLGLVRMREACARLGHPERAFEAAHVAGTNGKGSVCSMLATMARASGRRVGLYTSPHLCKFAERVQIDGVPATDDALFPVIDEVLARAPELTFFEAATLTAFTCFANARVDLGVVEVGLGGRLDATNILPAARVTAITRIAFDHTDRLGNDLASIAREKAGILRPGVPVIVGPLAPEAMAAVEEAAGAVGAPLVRAADDASARAFVRANPPALAGAHQEENAALAVVLARTLGLGDEAIARGLSEVRWPGRLESIATAQGPVLLDAAHNPDGARALASYLRGRGGPVALVFGAMADKDWGAMLAELAPLADARFYVAPSGRKAAALGDLAAAASGRVEASVADALREARAAAGPGGLVVVAGSIFLVGEARAMLLGLERDPPVAL